MKLTICVLAFVLSGCASFNAPTMSADQLKAVAADKNFSAVCATGTGVWGTVKTVYVNVDKSVVPNGGITVDSNTCSVTMTNVLPPKAEPVTVSK